LYIAPCPLFAAIYCIRSQWDQYVPQLIKTAINLYVTIPFAPHGEHSTLSIERTIGEGSVKKKSVLYFGNQMEHTNAIKGHNAEPLVVHKSRYSYGCALKNNVFFRL
jgi:hypothetical protein